MGVFYKEPNAADCQEGKVQLADKFLLLGRFQMGISIPYERPELAVE